MQRIFKRDSEEDRARHLRMRREAEIELPELAERDQLRRLLRDLAEQAGHVLTPAERGEPVPQERLQALRAAMEKALATRS